MIRFRPATPNDTLFIANAILSAVGVEHVTDDHLAQQARLCGRDDVLYSWHNTTIAEMDGTVVGSLTAYDGRDYRRMKAVTFPIIKALYGLDFMAMPDECAAGEYYLDSLYVLPEWRKQGIGTALIRQQIEQARQRRIPHVTLIVSPEKPAAAELYRRIGFADEGPLFAFNEHYTKMGMHLVLEPLLEVCAASLASARAAERAGAPRIELCQRLDLGGLTPSRDDIAACVRELSLRTFVLVRPRGGDFCYTESEMQVLLDDVRYCRDIGAAGVVVGFLHHDGSVNTDYCMRALEAARGMEVTFHRAFDRCTDWPSALETIIGCGFHRILTSGQQPIAVQGMETLKAIQQQAGDRIAILAGSGINAGNAADIIRATGVSEVHGSCKIHGYESDEAEIRRTLAAIRSLSSLQK